MNLINLSNRLNKLPIINLIFKNNGIISTTNIICNNINALNISNYSTKQKQQHTSNNKKNNNNDIINRGFKKPSFKTYSERHKPIEKNEFSEYGLCKEILQSINENEWTTPTEVQRKSIPLVFKGRNVVFSSITGSGKTGAYSLPFLQILTTFKRNKLNYLKNKRLQPQTDQQQQQDDQYELFNQEDRGDDNEDDIKIDTTRKQSKQQQQQDKLTIKPNLIDEQDLQDDHFEIEDEFEDFDEYGNPISQQYKNQLEREKEKEVEYYEKIKKLKDRNIKKEFNEIDPIGLILLPSKELVIQVSKEIQQLSKHITIDESEIQGGNKLRIATVIGGIGETKQIEQLKSGVDIIIGTPGRINALINQDILSMQQIRITVIDEFDKLFNLGFFPDVKEIFDFLPKVRSRTKPFSMQTILTSATLSHKLDKLITRFSPNHLLANLNSELTAPSNVRQHFYYVNYRQKTQLLLYFLRRGGKTSLKNQKSLVFARTQQRVEKITKTLLENNINALSIHADMSIAQRTDVVNKFKDASINGGTKTTILVCTDIMTRGIHIDDLDAVVNFDVPHVSEDYLHRIGRAGRNGRNGFSLTFVSPDRLIFKIGERVVGLDETHLLSNIEKSTGTIGKFSKIPGPWKGLDENNLNHHKSGQGSIISNRKDKQQKQQQSNEEDDEYLLDEDDDGDYIEDEVQGENNNNISIQQHNREEKFQNKQEKKAVTQILVKKNILETYKGPPTKDGLPRVRFNPNAKLRDSKISKIIVDRKGEIHDLPNLTDFKEGQYHQVLDDFDRKRASKRGIALPKKKTNVFLPSSIETKRSLQNIEKNPSRYNRGNSGGSKKSKSNVYDVNNDK